MIRDETRHDPETIALGLSKIAEIRAQLAERNPSIARARRAPEVRTPSPADLSRPVLDDDQWTPDRIAADMAAGSVRDDLRGRVVRLEAEVAQLRSALAAVLSAAAAGLHAPAHRVESALSESDPGSASRPDT